MVRLMAVPPFNASVSESSASFSTNDKTSSRRHTFSNVSLTKPSSLACLPRDILSNCIIVIHSFVNKSFQIAWRIQKPFGVKNKISLFIK